MSAEEDVCGYLIQGLSVGVSDVQDKREERLKLEVRAYGRTSSASDSSSDSVCVASDQRLEGRCDVVQCSIRLL